MQLFSRNRQPSPGIALVFFAGLLGACLLGIVSRADNLLAVFWPSNALLLGWLLRQRRLAGPLGWLLAASAFVAADLLTGSSLQLTLHMTAANLAGVAVGYVLLRRSLHFNRLLLGPAPVLALFLASIAAALAAAVVALPSASFLLGLDTGQTLVYWFSAELVCYVTLLPVVLLSGSGQPLLPARAPALQRWAPLISLAGSLALALLAGGPGALLFTMPALLWCALAYPTRLNALCVLVVCLGSLLGIAGGWLDLGMDEVTLRDVVSLRLGVAMMAVAPLLVAAMSASRERILKSLHHAAAHDALTATLSRAGFFQQAGQVIARRPRPLSALMLDVDHFKQINDRHGHAAGDRVLVDLAARLRTTLPDTALLGRLGGEEFAVLLPGCDVEQAQALAHRLCQRVDEEPFELLPGLPPLAVSLSIGVASQVDSSRLHIDTLLHRADQALYRAKKGGRNRVVAAAGED